jgi:hypothetical protein
MPVAWEPTVEPPEHSSPNPRDPGTNPSDDAFVGGSDRAFLQQRVPVILLNHLNEPLCRHSWRPVRHQQPGEQALVGNLFAQRSAALSSSRIEAPFLEHAMEQERDELNFRRGNEGHPMTPPVIQAVTGERGAKHLLVSKREPIDDIELEPGIGFAVVCQKETVRRISPGTRFHEPKRLEYSLQAGEVVPIHEEIYVASAAIEPVRVAQHAVPHAFLLEHLEHPPDQTRDRHIARGTSAGGHCFA